MRKAKEGCPASEEGKTIQWSQIPTLISKTELLMGQLQASLRKLERENAEARQELLKLTQQLKNMVNYYLYVIV